MKNAMKAQIEFAPRFELREDSDFTIAPAQPPKRYTREYFNSIGRVTRDEPTETLYGVALAALTFLASKARNGDGQALWQFADLARECCEGLSSITREKPEALAPLARYRNRWPMMRSKHPLLCDPDEWLNLIELGKSVPLQMDEYSKWKADHASDVAIQLLAYLTDKREANVRLIFKGGKKVRATSVLPEFSQISAPAWWKIAEHLLLQSYPKPETHWKLGRISTSPSRTSAGRKRQQIRDKIKARFFHMARLA